MNFSNLLNGMQTPQVVILVILGVFLVAMVVMTIIPQKKRQKQQQEMMNSLKVGTKIMTIGRLVGKITAFDAQANTVTINVGTDKNPTLIVMDRNGIGAVLDSIQPAAPAEAVNAENKVEEKKEEKVEDKADDKKENIVIEEAPEKKKRGKKYREETEENADEKKEEVAEEPKSDAE